MNREALADRLWDAFKNKEAIGALTEDIAEFSIEDAYRISEINLQRRTKEFNTRLVGRKIGLTSEAIQTWLNVDQPDFGFLTEDMAHETGATLAADDLMQPRIEAEIAFFLKEDLEGPGIDAAAVLAATECVAPALEIIDSRIKDWKIKIQDTVADNASSGAFVIGKERKNPKNLDLLLLGMKMSKNGKIVSTGAGAACLGDPAGAVAWLANTLKELGSALKAGEVVLSGALGPITPVEAGDEIVAEIRGLGTVSCKFK